MGSAAFFAPEIETLPVRVVPPSISNLSNGLRSGVLLAPFVRRQCAYRQRVNFIADQRAQTLIDQLVTSERAKAFEFGRNDQGPKMGIVVTVDLDDGIVESGFDQLAYFRWFHNVQLADHSSSLILGAQCNRNAYCFPLPHHVCVL